MRSVAKAFGSGLAWPSVLCVLLIVPVVLMTGGLNWPQAWVLLATVGLFSVCSSVALSVWRPASFKVRQSGLVVAPEEKQPLIDAIGSVSYIGFIIGWCAFIPVDVFNLHLLPSPGPVLSLVGILGLVVGQTIAFLAVWQNEFAAPTIHEQPEQRVIDTGIYGWVRHPLYAGNLVFFAGTAAWLGSVVALMGVLVMLGATLARIVIEERFLRSKLPDYGDYVRRVRGRLIPFIL